MSVRRIGADLSLRTCVHVSGCALAYVRGMCIFAWGYMFQYVLAYV
jgi:hypothetical protein